MEFSQILFLSLLFFIALLYSGVGHGGASGYLALMGLFHFSPEHMRPAALVLNIFVSGVAWFQFSRSAKMNTRLFLWLIMGSIPAAFIGAGITIDATVYKRILGAILLFQSLRLLGLIQIANQFKVSVSFLPVFIAGLSIGFLSGIIGIGGGIILSPLLLLFGWADMKQTALMSAVFIFLNSIAGVLGLFSTDTYFEPVLYLWVVVAFAGGLIGSWLGSIKVPSSKLKQLLGVVLIIAGIKLILL